MPDLYVKMAAGVYNRSERIAPGVLADYDAAGKLIGIEVNKVEQVTLDTGGVVQISTVEGTERDSDADE